MKIQRVIDLLNEIKNRSMRPPYYLGATTLKQINQIQDELELEVLKNNDKEFGNGSVQVT